MDRWTGFVGGCSTCLSGGETEDMSSELDTIPSFSEKRGNCRRIEQKDAAIPALPLYEDVFVILVG
ncbi:hypothetical protein PPTG_20677 [Phytophthora nicotianae INRA-310]|uniref:Uncharacterized protein n=1 Tax=Phytophthora nicotianae (strain INRA-310) TaxID=761204 RepID=W2RGB4_PHYN3|nr:hypothetical protein PPTG_20677 [Phytophthora nicotianae INRA-310]ETN23595.1 hypothetical protein PPTG_20677 [Phytophthora nicotianae INRA-310]